MNNLDEIFIKSYLSEYNEKEKNKILHNQEDLKIARQKQEKLRGMQEFLKKFVDLEIIVHHYDQYTKNSLKLEEREPQKFTFYIVDSSSKRWRPGVSIIFDHPAQVEIAIPNNEDEDGVIVIRVASDHPYSHLVEQKFTNFESAYEAIGKFLGKSTVKIGKDPKKYFKEQGSLGAVKKPVQSYDFTQDIPDSPPDEEDQSQTRRKPTSVSNTSIKKIGELFNLNKDKNKDE